MSYYTAIYKRRGFRAMVWQWFYNHNICPDCIKQLQWPFGTPHDHERNECKLVKHKDKWLYGFRDGRWLWFTLLGHPHGYMLPKWLAKKK